MSEQNDERGCARGPADNDRWPETLCYWRSYPAEQFDDNLRDEVRSCVRRISSTIEDWRAAIRGDAAAAVKVALRIRMPDEITVHLDFAMTVLLAAAFDDAGAALVMAHLIRRTPLDLVDRTGLSTSWLVHNIWCESRARKAHRSRDRGEKA
jgi:hypothetical protein